MGKPCWVERSGSGRVRATFLSLCYEERGDICAVVRLDGETIARLVHLSRVTRIEEDKGT